MKAITKLEDKLIETDARQFLVEVSPNFHEQIKDDIQKYFAVMSQVAFIIEEPYISKMELYYWSGRKVFLTINEFLKEDFKIVELKEGE